MENNKKITIADVAQALGVSKTTVSRAISGKGRIGEKTRTRVLQYIEENDYRPNVVAQGLAQSKTFNIGVVVPGSYALTDLPFFQECLVGIHEKASGMGYDVLLTFCNNEDISDLERIVQFQKVDGMILLRSYTRDLAIDYLLEEKVPFVVIGSTKRKGICMVDHDHRKACCELTEKLLKNGMRRIALIGGDEKLVVTKNRLDGFEKAYQNQHLSYDTHLLYRDCKDADAVKSAVKSILLQGADCIACMDDSICHNVLQVLELEKKKVPKDISVASFYGSPLPENGATPVASLFFDAKELGRQAANMLCEQMQGTLEHTKVLLEYECNLPTR